jgi:hypothetical protein
MRAEHAGAPCGRDAIGIGTTVRAKPGPIRQAPASRGDATPVGQTGGHARQSILRVHGIVSETLTMRVLAAVARAPASHRDPAPVGRPRHCPKQAILRVQRVAPEFRRFGAFAAAERGAATHQRAPMLIRATKIACVPSVGLNGTVAPIHRWLGAARARKRWREAIQARSARDRAGRRRRETPASPAGGCGRQNRLGRGTCGCSPDKK